MCILQVPRELSAVGLVRPVTVTFAVILELRKGINSLVHVNRSSMRFKYISWRRLDFAKEETLVVEKASQNGYSIMTASVIRQLEVNGGDVMAAPFVQSLALQGKKAAHSNLSIPQSMSLLVTIRIQRQLEQSNRRSSLIFISLCVPDVKTQLRGRGGAWK